MRCKWFGVLLLCVIAVRCIASEPELLSSRLLISTKSKLGEGALWNHKVRVFYWINIEEGLLHVYDLEKDTNYTHPVYQRIGTVVSVDTGQVLIALQNGIFRYNFKTRAFDMFSHPLAGKKGMRYNDGKCDPAGRFWVGSMGLKAEKKAASLYCIEANGKFTEPVDSVTISNGIVWTSDATKMYYIDTPTREIWGYDYDLKTGSIQNKYVAVKIPEGMGFPDGMTIDEDNMLWVAMYGGGCVAQFNPLTGNLMAKVLVDAPNVTSCAFGGSDLKTLFITTARQGMNDEKLKAYPEAGSVFVAFPGVKGVKPNYFNSTK